LYFLETYTLCARKPHAFYSTLFVSYPNMSMNFFNLKMCQFENLEMPQRNAEHFQII
jgi:hypothetical protein